MGSPGKGPLNGCMYVCMYVCKAVGFTTNRHWNHQLCSCNNGARVVVRVRACVQAAQREEAYEETISDLTDRLKDVRALTTPSNSQHCLQCFDTVGWASGRAPGL